MREIANRLVREQEQDCQLNLDRTHFMILPANTAGRSAPRKVRAVWPLPKFIKTIACAAVVFAIFWIISQPATLAALAAGQPPTDRLLPDWQPAGDSGGNAGALLAASSSFYSSLQSAQSSQVVTGSQQTACGRIWFSQPDPETLPIWLTTPASADELETDIPYTYLAGQLIQNGVVSAADCAGGGLLENGSANPCGLERARVAVTEWQNRFDEAIYQAAVDNGIPAWLLKNLIAQESQFWPAAAPTQAHYGLGQTVEAGLDPFLIWYPEYFQRLCTSVLDAQVCVSGYGSLSPRYQAMVRGYAISSLIDVSCPSCEYEINMDKALSSIDIFAKMVVANCHQTGQLITVQTGLTPGRVSSYEDLWDFTMANYNAGAGCMSEAYRATLQRSDPLTWSRVSRNLQGGCRTALEYVASIEE